MALDLPAFERPAKATSTCEGGRPLSSAADVKKVMSRNRSDWVMSYVKIIVRSGAGVVPGPAVTGSVHESFYRDGCRTCIRIHHFR